MKTQHYPLRRIAVGIFSLLATGAVFAKGEVTAITTHTEPATTTSTYPGSDALDYAWGQGVNLIIDSFDFGGNTYVYHTAANSVIIRRSSGATPCSLFAETTDSPRNYKADFPGTGSSCDMAAVMSGNIINRGALDVFNNTHDSGTKKNIERIDFIFTDGITAPALAANLTETGHVVTEKSGNNAVKIAAITVLDGSGAPYTYGPLVEVKPSGCDATTEVCYGTGLGDFQANDFLHSPDGDRPTRNAGHSEFLGMAFVTLDDLGIGVNQEYFGFSYFASDVDAAMDLVGLTDLPTTTSVTNGHGDADIYGGTAGYFVLASLIPPVAVNDTATTAQDQAVIINVLNNDTPTTGLTVSQITTAPANGNAVINNADNTVTYTPVSGFTGTNTFVYEINGMGGTDTATVTVTIGPDADNDGIVDSIDIDDDNDGILDSIEGDGDFDNDGTINRLDLDSDGDGINDLEESGLRESLQNSLDADGDGRIDNTQLFGANGLADALESTPNTPNTPDYSGSGNAETPVDTDRDTHPDFLDLDSDNDGIHDVIEAGFTDPDHDGRVAAGETSINHPLDSDGGGIADYRDLDSDNDGLADIIEAGGVDSNGDALVDNFLDNDVNGHDDTLQSSPLPVPDTDGDNLPDYRDLDSDNDGLPDLIEAGGTDSDLDGRVDGFAEGGDPDGDGITNTLRSGSGGQPLPDLDSDNDNIPDRLEIDSDDDGVMDIAEAGLEDTDGNGLVDDFTDDDGDGFDDAAQAVLTAGGALPDTDGNGVPDYRECNCGAGPRLKTGLKGHGAGSADWLLLGLPLAMLAWRRRRLRLAPALAALLIVPLGANAEKSPADRDFDGRWYLGVNGGMTLLEPEAQCPCYSVGDDQDTGYSVFIGRDLSKRFSLEGYFADLGEAGINYQDAEAGKVGYEHFGLSLLGYFYNNRSAGDYKNGYDDEGYHRREGLSLFARAGLGKMENESRIDYERVEDVHLHLGAGLEYGWANGFAGRAELISYDEDAKLVSLGLLKRFGKVAAYQAPAPEPKPAPVIKPKPKPAVVPAPPPPPKPAPVVAPEPEPLYLPVVYFKHDKWELTDKSRQELNELAKTLSERQELRIAVRGHTDADGEAEYNQSLSKRRATFVARYLQSKGVQAERMVGKAYGEELPIADNESVEGKQQNRRVDFEIIE